MFNWKVKEIKATNAIFLGDKTEGEGRPFKARFLQAGLVKYDFGVCLLKKETIDRFVNTFIDCPVIINHKDDIKKEDKQGTIKSIWFAPEDGWFWCSGTLDEEAAEKVEKGFNVSCQYRITEYSNNTENKLHNGNPYDKEILNGVFEHLAIVKTPRYEDAYIAVNAIMATNEDHWITIGADEESGKKGTHVLVKDGETNKEATERKVAEWKEKRGKKEITKKREIEHKGAKIDISPDGKYSDIRIYAPEGKTFQNGDTFYTTTALTENAEEHAKKIIDGTFDRNEWLDKKDTQKSREIEHNGAKANIKPDGKYADIKIFAPEGKTFPNGDSWYSTQKETEKAEEQVKEIIEKTKWIDKKQPGTKEEGENNIALKYYKRQVSKKLRKLETPEEKQKYIDDLEKKLKDHSDDPNFVKVVKWAKEQQTASNSFLDSFKDFVYNRLTEELNDRLGE